MQYVLARSNASIEFTLSDVEKVAPTYQNTTSSKCVGTESDEART